jgi:hypothetical protein
MTAAEVSKPSQTTVKTLFALSGNYCYFYRPDGQRCEEPLTNPMWHQVKGQIAHICADAPGGPRYDPNQTPQERHGFENLMLLCPNHHTLIDQLGPDNYPPEVLREMKANAEAAAPTFPVWADEAALERFARLALGGIGTFSIGESTIGG